MDLVRFVGLVSFYVLLSVSNALRLNRVEDIEARLYGSNLNNYTIYRLPELINLFKSTNYNKNIPTMFYIHGFQVNPSQNDYTDPIQGLLSTMIGKKNVVAIDWSNIADIFNYFEVVPSVQKVATAITAEFKKAILDKLITVEFIKLVGHSLGGQMSGLIGKALQAAGYKLKEIIALDPPGIGFDFLKMSDKLKKTDADYVFVLHTDSLILGSSQSMGTHDFWPNGGKYQYWCFFFDCSHRRAIAYYVESLRNPNAFAATRFNNYMEFLAYNNKQNANLPYIYMMPTVPTDAPQGNYYFTTNGEYPYGRGLNGRYFS